MQKDYATTITEFARREKELAEINLSSWLRKRSPREPYLWQDRWVIVRGSYILWSHTQIDTQHPDIAKERKRFKQVVSFDDVQEIEPVMKGKKHNMFKIVVKSHQKNASVKEFVFKAKTETDRDHWVEQLMKYKEFHDDMMAFREKKD